MAEYKRKKSAVEKMLIVGIISSISFMAIKFSPRMISSVFSEKIKNEKHLERMLNEEVSKLGMKNKKISARFGEIPYKLGATIEHPDGSYEIILNKGRDRGVLKHELYHIYDEHFKVIKSPQDDFLKYWFILEPKCDIYETFGLKL